MFGCALATPGYRPPGLVKYLSDPASVHLELVPKKPGPEPAQPGCCQLHDDSRRSASCAPFGTPQVQLNVEMPAEHGLYELHRASGIALYSVTQRIGAKNASAAEARTLNETRGAPC